MSTPPAGYGPPWGPGQPPRHDQPIGYGPVAYTPYGPPPPHGPRHWSGVKVFFVVWGLAVVVCLVAGLLLSGLAAAVLGGATRGLGVTADEQAVLDLFVGTGIVFVLIFGTLVGVMTGVVSGFFAAGTAALTHAKLSPAGTGGLAALVATVLPGGVGIAPFAAVGGGIAEVAVLALVPTVLLFCALFTITWRVAVRSHRAAVGG